jgi:tight adherence protein C
MTSAQLLFLVIVFVIACGLVWLGMMLFSPGTLRARLAGSTVRSEADDADRRRGWVDQVVRAVRPLTKLSMPEEGWEKSALRARFMNAGWRNPAAPALYFASKTALALTLPALAGIGIAFMPVTPDGTRVLFLLLVAASCGYYLPNVVLARVVKRRKREIFETIPDALDLLTVCVEAGLSLERALVKVAAEIHIKSVTLAQEFQLVLMQSERFGTSIGDALRVYSENLRNKRRVIAEEAAAKIGLKLLFPLIFCIFPTLLMVLLGPAVIQLTRVFGSVLSNQ